MATMLSHEPGSQLHLIDDRAPVTDPDPRPHVVILGGGFAGLSAARALRKAPVRVTLIDKRNFHLFQPLLYQVATASLSPAEVAYPIRSILRRQRNATVLLGEATGIDLDRWEVVLKDGRVPYDYLIVATGAQSSYFGHDDWEAVAPGLKSMEEALDIRRRVFRAFELAERETDPERRRALLTFVVVGGGATGVELAGALAEISRQTLRGEFRSIDPADARILLVEGGATLLKGYPERLTTAARRSLEKLGVEVRTGARVQDIAPGRVRLPDETIAAETALWAAGVAAHELGGDLGADRSRGGRVPVLDTLQLAGHRNVFVAGDLAASAGKDGEDLPGVAQVAMQGGKLAGKNIARLVKGKPPKPFRYFDKGTMATIGWNRAVAQIGPFQLSGFIAWAIWAFIHIAYLITYRSRAAVMLQWAWAYITRSRASRLITGSPAARDEALPREGLDDIDAELRAA
jgi:NADH:ubiquinone reductase (H+-translocating)